MHPFDSTTRSRRPSLSIPVRRGRGKGKLLGTMRRRHELLAMASPSCCCMIGLVLLLLAPSARAQQRAQTDPSEVAALNAIFGRWGLRATTAWNISGEPCSGAAIDDATDIDNDPTFNPAIKCVCSYNASTVCHITSLKVYALDVVGQIPAELQNLPYLTNLYELFPPRSFNANGRQLKVLDIQAAVPLVSV